MARKISVEIVGDSRSLERAFARSSKSAQRFQGSMTGVSRGVSSAFAALGVTFGAAGLVAGIKKSVDAASSLNEEMSKSKVVFGDSQAAIDAWSKTTSNAFGISQSDALAAASNFGLLFDTIGKGSKQTARMSRRFVELAGDLASFFDVSTDEALEKLRSGLAGEAEPLRQFGIFIDEASVKAEAYRSGIAKTGSELTQAQKLQARYNLIIGQSRKAQGDAARTSDSWANVQRRLSALIDETAARIGTALLPKLSELGGELADWLSDTKNQKRIQDTLNDAVETTTSVVGTFANAVKTATPFIKKMNTQLGGTEDSIKKIGIALAGGKLIQQLGKLRGGGGAAGGAGRGPGLFGSIAIALGAQQLSDVVRKIPGWEANFKRLGGGIFSVADALGLTTTQAEAYADALDRIAAKQNEVAKGFGAREGPEGGFPRFATGDDGAGGGGGGARGGRRRRGTTAAERAAAARAAAVRIAGVDARLARQLDRLQDLSLRKQLAGLRALARDRRSRLSVTHDVTRRRTLEDQILDIMREQRSVQEQIGDQVRATNQALKDRADAIKSAVLDRLQRRQTAVLNQRALREAQEQLRLARRIGGPVGIRQARENLQDVNFDILRARLEAAPARLTRGGQFALGNIVTINIHGVTDPNQVAIKVDQILRKRGRRTSNPKATTSPAGAAR